MLLRRHVGHGLWPTAAAVVAHAGDDVADQHGPRDASADARR
jgi:hypothetical protein